MTANIKSIAVIGVLGVVLLVGAYYLQKLSPTPEASKLNMKCPEDYMSEEERKSDLEVFLTEFKASNPDATIEDLGNVRLKFLEDNNCQKTLDFLRNNPDVSGDIKDRVVSGENTEPVEFTEEELQGYYSAYSDPHVIHVRTALNGYLDGTNTGMDNPEFVMRPRTEDGITSGLDSFDRSYYEGKFIVFAINDNIGGGKEIDLVFRDKPDKMFAAWVYSAGEGHYDLRGFWQKPDFTEEVMQRVSAAYRRFLDDKDHAL